MTTFSACLRLFRTSVLWPLVVVITSSCAGLDGSSNASCNTSSGDYASCFVKFEVEGFSSGDPSGVYYYLVLDDQQYDDETALKLLGYASYVLRYRGLVEAMYEDQAEYLLVVSYGKTGANNSQQYFELAAGSKRVYESMGEFRPSWVATSIHEGKPTNQENMLALHALAIREFAGLPVTGPSSYRSYDPNSAVVKNIKKEVESFIATDTVIQQ